MDRTIETLIIGGGQAGLSLSYFLQRRGREHVVLEKANQPGDAWRSQRWDAFTLVSPNWTFQLPGAVYDGDRPDEFLTRAEVVATFQRYPQRYHLPVEYNTQVNTVEPNDHAGYTVHTQHGRFRARNVVVATGLYQRPKIPSHAARIPSGVTQLHCGAYRNPQALPPGAVLVVGSAQSGSQITEDLFNAGRKVYLSTGSSPRVPRTYRGRDIFAWADQIGFFNHTPDQLPSPGMRFAANPLAVGSADHHDISLHLFHRRGVALLGHLRGFEDGKFLFAADLRENLAKSDQSGDRLLGMIDQFIAAKGIVAPPNTTSLPDDAYRAPDIDHLDLQAAGISTVIWANGFAFDFSMVRLPVTDNSGFPLTDRGVTKYPGLYFLGLPWLYRRKSGLLLGVGEDAAYLAEKIAG